MSHAPDTPDKSNSGAVRVVAAFLWGFGAATLAYGLWRTLVAGVPIQESVLFFSMTAICAGIGTAFYGLSASKRKT